MIAKTAAVLAAAMVMTGAAAASPGNGYPVAGASGVVTRIDHISFDDGRAVELFQLLNGRLGLPMLWPMSDYGGFSSGGVFLGNVALEVGRLSGAPDAGRVNGVAFAPAVSAAASAAELDRRGLAHTAPADFPTKGMAQWTLVDAKGVGPLRVFVCDYRIDTRSGLEAATASLGSAQGGPLGVVRVRDLTFEDPDPTAARARWAAFLAPSLSSGPAVRVTAGKTARLAAITLEVASLVRAKAALRAESIAVDETAGELRLDRGLHGLPLRLVEARRP